MARKSTLQTVLEWLRAAPAGTSVTAAAMVDLLAPVAESEPVVEFEPTPPSWREKLWTVPAETRIGVAELCEATGRPRSWVYRATSAGSIPHRKLDGELVFTVGEVRAWIREREEVVISGPMESVRHHLKAS